MKVGHSNINPQSKEVRLSYPQLKRGPLVYLLFHLFFHLNIVSDIKADEATLQIMQLSYGIHDTGQFWTVGKNVEITGNSIICQFSTIQTNFLNSLPHPLEISFFKWRRLINPIAKTWLTVTLFWFHGTTVVWKTKSILLIFCSMDVSVRCWGKGLNGLSILEYLETKQGTW